MPLTWQISYAVHAIVKNNNYNNMPISQECDNNLKKSIQCSMASGLIEQIRSQLYGQHSCCDNTGANLKRYAAYYMLTVYGKIDAAYPGTYITLNDKQLQCLCAWAAKYINVSSI